MNFIRSQQENSDSGKLKISLTSEENSFPVPDASIQISYTGVSEDTLEKVTTNSSGRIQSGPRH